jgi:hypothetical protein
VEERFQELAVIDKTPQGTTLLQKRRKLFFLGSDCGWDCLLLDLTSQEGGRLLIFDLRLEQFLVEVNDKKVCPLPDLFQLRSVFHLRSP